MAQEVNRNIISSQAYHQIPKQSQDILKMAQITLSGLFEYVYVTFGLRNVVQIMQRKVSQEEGESASKYYPNVEFRECSAAEGVHSVEVAFNEFLKTVAKSKDSKKRLTPNHLTVSKSPSPRRHSAGNSALSHWWRRPRSSSACEQNRQDRTYTM
ncbi:ras-related and estrogen-regulated growth inhibitor-like protein [Nephila pilipes]|uniref:Ras-related and estrogen-regulated growth inhibitor-like protein n=1 Tax=Nephila pilipes TaxID=299642 RepID=A0A8X6NZA0_NEPPI|nr:ras-related and estrogen-regulated growth inhibitor-like protein [Nephila pilipes]